MERGLSSEEAVDEAIDWCISKGYLKDYLLQKRGEAKLMLLNFDENDYKHALEIERQEGREEGLAQGREERERLEAELNKLKEELERFKVAAGTV